VTSPTVPDTGSRPVNIPGLTAFGGLAGAAAQLAGVATDKTDYTSLNPVDGLNDAAAAVRAWSADRHNWTRVMWFGAGVICFAIGASMLVRRPVTDAVAQVANVVPSGKAVKAATGAVK
jgi:hypothetical protein